MNNVFLHSEMGEEIYKKVPPSYDEKLANNIVCKLKKALCSLKQSPHA